MSSWPWGDGEGEDWENKTDYHRVVPESTWTKLPALEVDYAIWPSLVVNRRVGYFFLFSLRLFTKGSGRNYYSYITHSSRWSSTLDVSTTGRRTSVKQVYLCLFFSSYINSACPPLRYDVPMAVNLHPKQAWREAIKEVYRIGKNKWLWAMWWWL